uniref:PRA1 family protein n=1 Tax=Oryza punctata TaxID=4537 RepID=A0A0E0KZJ5_ORYPU
MPFLSIIGWSHRPFQSQSQTPSPPRQVHFASLAGAGHRPPPPPPPSDPDMSKYGTIPTSSDGAPPGTSSPLDFISRAKARGATALAERRPWRELADPRAASVPRGFGGAYRRARANLSHFSMNYAIVVLAVVFLSLLWHPVSLIVFLACMVAWLFLYFLRDEPLALCGRAVGEGAVLAVLSVLTLVLLLLTGATVNILTSLLVGVVLVLIHAVFHRPADSIDEEAGRYYTPVPPQPSY